MALAAVGTPGMTLAGLSVAVDLPERDLHSLLVALVARGRVRCLGEATTTHYRYGGPPPALVTIPRTIARTIPRPPAVSPSGPARTSIPRPQAGPELVPPRARR